MVDREETLRGKKTKERKERQTKCIQCVLVDTAWGVYSHRNSDKLVIFFYPTSVATALTLQTWLHSWGGPHRKLYCPAAAGSDRILSLGLSEGKQARVLIISPTAFIHVPQNFYTCPLKAGLSKSLSSNTAQLPSGNTGAGCRRKACLFGRHFCTFSCNGVLHSLQLFEQLLATWQRVAWFVGAGAGASSWDRSGGHWFARWSHLSSPRRLSGWWHGTFPEREDKEFTPITYIAGQRNHVTGVH